MTKSDSAYKSFLNQHRDALACLALVLTTLCVYWQIQSFDFVFFDDPEYVYNNRQVQAGLTREGIIWSFTFSDKEKTYWHPLTWLSHMLDCELYGLAPGMHHLSNLMLHLANSLLLFWVFKQMTGARWRSFFVAALFALHPINVESVAWLSERKNVLSTFFWMLTLLSYVNYCSRRSLFRYLLTLFVFGLGLLAKPILVTLPFVFLLLDYWPLGRIRFGKEIIDNKNEETRSISGFRESSISHLLFEKIPFFVLTAISICLSTWSNQNQIDLISSEAVPIKLRFANAMVSYVSYIGKMIWPQNLAVLYPFPETMLPVWQVAGSGLLLVCVSTLMIWSLRRKPYLSVGWLWYLGTLVPVIGLVQAGLWPAMADRWAYVPLIGLFMITSWGAYDLVATWQYRKKCLAILATIVLTILTTMTWTQAEYWKNSLTLFSHTLEITSNNYVTHNNLGHVLIKTGRIDQGIAHCREALRINPNYSDAHGTLGNGLFAQGKLDEAIIHYSEALVLNPMNEKTYNNMGVALYKKGKINEAISHFKKALQLKPGYIMAKKNLINALVKQRN